MLFVENGKNKIKKYPLEGKLKGISDKQIQAHRDKLYAGYVNKMNAIQIKLQECRDKGEGAPRDLKVEEPFAVNGTFLHEGYFENLGKGVECSGKIKELIERDFGSFDVWKKEFVSTATASRGWVVLAINLLDGRLHNYLCDRHDVGGVWWSLPMVVLDVYEHAYMIDYGVDRASYIDAFFKNLDWNAVNKRIEQIKEIPKVLEH
ncbi:superoxide dismutase [Candidatus Woesearchaeota archaeon CG10_big_fil_rev_8_21_14_0_10_34_8]|nr:MAG: superoxide dismutase [Candidatus Woesearchaeota archaeon CG10_big_fil_rev_8_21_14_0_10_34_8]